MRTKTEINLVHKELTDEETYKKLKEIYKKYPDISMNPREWKRLRLVEIKKEGKVWSK